MELLDKLARADIDPALFAQVQALLAENDFKIKALTFELAYYKRVRYGKASEALVGEQRILFDETVDMDLAAINEELHCTVIFPLAIVMFARSRQVDTLCQAAVSDSANRSP